MPLLATMVVMVVVGKLVLWSKTPGVVKGEETLKAASFAKLSICNPAAGVVKITFWVSFWTSVV